jgi:hypothetical protein
MLTAADLTPQDWETADGLLSEVDFMLEELDIDWDFIPEDAELLDEDDE